MSRVVYLPEARADFYEIWRYLVDASESFDAADRVVKSIESACRLHATQPLTGEYRPELAESVRSFTAMNYVVFYVPQADGIEVIQIIHGSRDIANWFRR